MGMFSIRPTTEEDHDLITAFMVELWGAEIVVSRGVVYKPAVLPGFIAIQSEVPVGLLTYHIDGTDCEIVTLNSLRKELGIGSALIDAACQVAVEADCDRVWFITTNDNLNMLGFSQRRGFELVAVHRGAIAESRKLKPQIPLIGANDIPIRDEIELELLLS